MYVGGKHWLKQATLLYSLNNCCICGKGQLHRATVSYSLRRSLFLKFPFIGLLGCLWDGWNSVFTLAPAWFSFIITSFLCLFPHICFFCFSLFVVTSQCQHFWIYAANGLFFLVLLSNRFELIIIIYYIESFVVGWLESPQKMIFV